MDRPLRLGVAGMGRGFMLMLPTLAADPRLEIIAGADPRPEARRRFAEEFKARSYETVEELCRDAAVEAIYIATPHQLHAPNALAAAAAGKHMLVEKPMALTLDDCRAMTEAARRGKVHLLVGHSHSYDAPIAATRRLIAGGAYGRLRMITALNFTDFLYRPRRPEELDTAQGGGVIFSQAAHQIDIIRLLGGGLLRSIRAAVGNWDAARSTEGAYTALLTFADGAVATITYSGYAHFDSDELCGWIGESGLPKDPERYGEMRKLLAQVKGAEAETAFKARRGYGVDAKTAAAAAPSQPFHEHFGFLVASCEAADLRPLPDRVLIYGNDLRASHALPKPSVPRAEVIDELFAAVRHGVPPLHSGEWAMATLEACLGLLRSAKEQRDIPLEAQIAAAVVA